MVSYRNFKQCVWKIEINLLDGLRITKKYQFWKTKKKEVFIGFHDQNLNAKAYSAFTLWFCSRQYAAFVIKF